MRPFLLYHRHVGETIPPLLPLCKKQLPQSRKLLQTEALEVSGGRSPPIVNPKPATCAVVSEPLRSKGFQSPFAARRAEGSQENGAKVVKRNAAGEFFDEQKQLPQSRKLL